jgi:hypothetical protein
MQYIQVFSSMISRRNKNEENSQTNTAANKEKGSETKL